jgi:hypothetical protein
MAKFKKKAKKLKRSEKHYLFAVLGNILKFGFSKKDIKDILKKI